MMKFAAAAAMFILLMGFGCSKSGDLTDSLAKESYSLGYRFGENMKSQGTEIDPKIYMQGLVDAMEGRESLLSEEEIEGVLTGLQQKMMAAQQKSQMEEAERNKAEGIDFLEKNVREEGVVTLSSGLQYSVIEEGSGKSPQVTDVVTVHYRGTLIDGTEFDSSYSRGEPASFRVDGVIAGWTEALQLMKVGDKWKIFIPYELAYGERGRPPVIPPASVLIFEVELISIQ